MLMRSWNTNLRHRWCWLLGCGHVTGRTRIECLESFWTCQWFESDSEGGLKSLLMWQWNWSYGNPWRVQLEVEHNIFLLIEDYGFCDCCCCCGFQQCNPPSHFVNGHTCQLCDSWSAIVCIHIVSGNRWPWLVSVSVGVDACWCYAFINRWSQCCLGCCVKSSVVWTRTKTVSRSPLSGRWLPPARLLRLLMWYVV